MRLPRPHDTGGGGESKTLCSKEWGGGHFSHQEIDLFWGLLSLFRPIIIFLFVWRVGGVFVF